MSENTNTTDIVLTDDDTTAKALRDTIRAAVNGVTKYAAYVEAHNVTRANVADHARALAAFTYPNETPVQKKDGVRTKFGNAVQAAGKGLRSALEDDEVAPKPVALRATLSGEGGGSIVITREENADLYDALVSMIHGEPANQAA